MAGRKPRPAAPRAARKGDQVLRHSDVMGAAAPIGGVIITPKYVGPRRLMEVAVASNSDPS